ncbi:MAG TPA: cytochrome c oxidase subunit 4 [Micromonosporaceae bacterium]
MRIESRIFYIVAGALLLLSGTYAWGTDKLSRVDWAGTMALMLAGGLAAMIGLYFGLVANRIPDRPEDRGDAEIAEGTGDVGFFAPGSYWPFGIALSGTVIGLGLALELWWLAVAAGVALLLTAGGLTFEYYTGTRRGLD